VKRLKELEERILEFEVWKNEYPLYIQLEEEFQKPDMDEYQSSPRRGTLQFEDSVPRLTWLSTLSPFHRFIGKALSYVSSRPSVFYGEIVTESATVFATEAVKHSALIKATNLEVSLDSKYAIAPPRG
jgi:hypothetical protein